MSHFRSILTGLALVPLAGCAELKMAPIEEYPVSVQRVVLISLDGVRGDAIPYMPTLAALTQRALWTDAMHTVLPAITLPAHLSMLTGRDVTEYAITHNTMDAGIAAVMRINGITPVFAWARADSMRTAAVAGMSLIPPSQRAEAQSFFAVDTLVAVDSDAPALANATLALMRGDAGIGLMFVHFPDADFAGHTYGWIEANGVHTSAYRAALARVDSAIAMLWNEVSASVDAGHTAVLITADHGGGHGEGCESGEAPTHTHCSAHPGDARVPFALVARDVTARRVTDSLTITQVAPTVGALLGMPVPERTAAPIAVF
jgi:predicted AlkP superfamily pyrophosphatase or phosphodiesterase